MVTLLIRSSAFAHTHTHPHNVHCLRLCTLSSYESKRSALDHKYRSVRFNWNPHKHKIDYKWYETGNQLSVFVSALHMIISVIPLFVK